MPVFISDKGVEWFDYCWLCIRKGVKSKKIISVICIFGTFGANSDEITAARKLIAGADQPSNKYTVR